MMKSIYTPMSGAVAYASQDRLTGVELPESVISKVMLLTRIPYRSSLGFQNRDLMLRASALQIVKNFYVAFEQQHCQKKSWLLACVDKKITIASTDFSVSCAVR